MKQQLDNIINRLASDPYFAIRLVNADNLKVIGVNLTGEKMLEEAGSIEGFFNEVVESGTTSFVIQPRRKNGSSWKDDGTVVRIDTKLPDSATAETATPTLLPTPPLAHIPEILPGLAGGLNAQMIYQHMDYPRVMADNRELTAENKRLKEKIEEMKEAALESRFSETKAQGQKDMLNGFIEQMPAILTAVGSLKGGNSAAVQTAGLAQPVPESSEVKQNLIDGIRNTSDSVASYILLTLRGALTVDGFGSDLEQLLIKHKLIPNENA
ncbi:hypothetical protein [Flavobacterium sp. AG291]|uniref:hypothetical protein n=1 Tax=Flavobacterium sp. AG291 TaxID=2184000 RepID=UPI000E2C60DD|nr:hypothetical protein [Flavobacterium sp. AG291]RDI07046.1 hypothetical protein DEU42_113146 [Flavobacterium sp. AG291]